MLEGSFLSFIDGKGDCYTNIICSEIWIYRVYWASFGYVFEGVSEGVIHLLYEELLQEMQHLSSSVLRKELLFCCGSSFFQ